MIGDVDILALGLATWFALSFAGLAILGLVSIIKEKFK